MPDLGPFAIAGLSTGAVYVLAGVGLVVLYRASGVLNLAQGGLTGVSIDTLVGAILIAASSNNILKAFYAAFFAGGRATAASAAALVVLAATGVAIALMIIRLSS